MLGDYMSYTDVDNYTEEYVRDFLELLINKLDDLDNIDFFGTEGWRCYLGIDE